MTAACFFRYAWIAPDRFEALLPPSDALDRLAGHLRDGPALADALPAGALRSDAIARLQRFAARPLLRGLPAGSLIRSAARWAADQRERQAERLAGWCGALRECLDDCADADADDARDGAFLDGLAQTDFPALLLWSNPALARHLFVRGDGGARPAPLLSANPKARRKAATAALRYALGTFGRFGPRGGWIGSGFAVADGTAGPARIERRDERLRIEPDIGWAARTWFADDPGGIVAGEDAWAYVRRKLKRRGAAPALSALDRLHAAAEHLGQRAWSFADADAFLHGATACLDAAGGGRAHPWWVSRVAVRELHVRSDLPPDCDRLYAAARAGVPAGEPAPGGGPYPLRLERGDPAAPIVAADEFPDWIVDADAVRRAGPFLPEQGPRSAAVVIHVEGGRARYRLHEPNPRRTADIAARHLDDAPLYLRCDAASIAIAPGETLSDQRLLRRAGREMAVDRIPAGRDAMYRFPLTAGSGAQIAREMASPRYGATPDLLPIPFDDAAARSLSFGRLDPLHRVWMLPPEQARALAAELRTPGRFAAFYRLELHAALGCPRWIGLMIDGKMSRLPTGSPVGFRPLLHACRTATAPIVVRAEVYHALRPLLADEQGHPLSCEIYVAAVPDPATPPSRQPAVAALCGAA